MSTTDEQTRIPGTEPEDSSERAPRRARRRGGKSVGGMGSHPLANVIEQSEESESAEVPESCISESVKSPNWSESTRMCFDIGKASFE